MSLLDPDSPVPQLGDLGRTHLMGIGGAGMSGLARLLAGRGLVVSGCDAHSTVVADTLRELGIGVAVGHDPAHVQTTDTLVLSSAIRPDNPELVEARARHRLVVPRAAALAAVMADRRRLVVAGTHGKTTTTSMLTAVLQAAGRDPSYAIGGDLAGPGSNAAAGAGADFVAEGDESDGSFLLLRPHGAIVTNVEADHLDNYGTDAAVAGSFREFVRRIEPAGIVLLGADDDGACALAAPAGERGLTVRRFGTATDADVRVERWRPAEPGSVFDLVVDGRRLGEVHLAVPGEINARNAAGAAGLALGLGVSFAEVATGLAAFRGVRRRFELKGTAGGVRLYDDYAHHPTEVRDGALRLGRQAAGDGRLIAVFQPHLYSRTRQFAGEFAAALGAADLVVVLDVYAAREDPIPGVDGATIAGRVQLPADRVRFEPDRAAVPGLVASLARPGDVVMTVGAGDVTELGPLILQRLAAGN
ncbi:MAG TPA: UDP-N-acetylmuramate--L-alanine ligase [Mycobacteriales bacterium]|nr:UDP-N-acetylmuramate--L-alanine ligase [Mycobacteriales bacterium]